MDILLSLLLIHVIELVVFGVFLIVRKNRTLENLVIEQQKYIDGLNILITQLDENLSAINDKIYVDSDEEIREVFNNVKVIKSQINSLL